MCIAFVIKCENKCEQRVRSRCRGCGHRLTEGINLNSVLIVKFMESDDYTSTYHKVHSFYNQYKFELR